MEGGPDRTEGVPQLPPDESSGIGWGDDSLFFFDAVSIIKSKLITDCNAICK